MRSNFLYAYFDLSNNLILKIQEKRDDQMAFILERVTLLGCISSNFE